MHVERETLKHRIDILCDYDKELYSKMEKDKWDFVEEKPIENVSRFVQLQRRIVNTDPSRITKLNELLFFHQKVIVFYNFNYERDMILDLLHELNLPYGEWNGKMHTSIPETERWAYIVQYNAGSEGWNCSDTNVIIFYSLNYSYRMTHQAAGRIDRRNTPFKDLYYYYFYSKSSIDGAILKSLEKKKDFNEKKYCQKMTS